MTLTPQQILDLLDTHVVGQTRAKRAVAVALRNRWRRRQLPAEVAANVYPKNILLIGPTGVGKTEIARRLAVLAKAPFVKVEASKYSEVGYHGRDVESMVRDLMESAVALVKDEYRVRVDADAARLANDRIMAALCENRDLSTGEEIDFGDLASSGLAFAGPGGEIWRPGDPVPGQEHDDEEEDEDREARQEVRQQLDAGELEDEVVEVEVPDQNAPNLSLTGPQGMEAMGIDARALQQLWGRAPSTKVRKLSVRNARSVLAAEEADKLMDEDAICQEAVRRAENDGIIFIDEIDKVIGAGSGGGPDVSREGVQRDLLPIVEGCAVYTRYGHVRTDHILFLAAGAFHFHKPSELIPELQGRFPVRVALQPLTEADFVRILTEPQHSLLKQYQALFETEGVQLQFTDAGIAKLAAAAFRANKVTQNIGARRLLTVLEKCLEELAFVAAERSGETVVVDEKLVDDVIGDQADDEDLIPYDM